MCGRVVVPKTEDLVRDLRLKLKSDRRMDRNLNVAPTMVVPVMTNSQPGDLQYFTWSLIPPFSKTGKQDFKLSTFNATIEKLDKSPLWKPLIGKRHCVVITDGFYEWNYDDPIKKKGGHPHYIKSKDEPFTFMAGLWSAWKNPDTGEYTPSCTIITIPANPLMAKIHNTKGRMPAFLTSQTFKLWLDDDLSYRERKQALEPVENDFLEVYPIKKVGDGEEFDRLIGIN